MARVTRKKYTYAQKKAYYMGYGAGLCRTPSSQLDPILDCRRGLGQDPVLCLSARAGYSAGKKDHFRVPFAKKHPR